MKFSCEMYRDGGCELMRTKETQFAEAQQLILDGGIRKRELKKQLAEAQKAQKVLDKIKETITAEIDLPICFERAEVFRYVLAKIEALELKAVQK